MMDTPSASGPSAPNATVAPKKAPVSYVRRAGSLLLGPKLRSTTPGITGVVDYLARQDGGDDFFNVKILSPPGPEGITKNDTQSRLLFYTEVEMLEALKGVNGVPRQFGTFLEIFDKEVNVEGKMVATGEKENRMVHQIECYTPHDFSPQYTRFLSLQQIATRLKNIPEFMAMKIFHKLMKVVADVHDRNIIHRDIKLDNVIVDMDSLNVRLVNFGLGKKLKEEKEVLPAGKDQRGSPGYVSPELVGSMGYYGKPVDMYALGVCLYFMFYGTYPFMANSFPELVHKIRQGNYLIPVEYGISQESVKFLQALLNKDSEKRPTAREAIVKIEKILRLELFLLDKFIQVVPSAPSSDEKSAEGPPGVVIEEVTGLPSRNRRPEDDQEEEWDARKVPRVTPPHIRRERRRQNLIRRKIWAASWAHQYAGRLRMGPVVEARKRRNKRLTARVARNNVAKELIFRMKIEGPRPRYPDLRFYFFRSWTIRVKFNQ